MAKIALRVYNHEIESLIEGGQVDEALAHCQYILKIFPMHIDTYRLLGKAYLEARRYSDATDIFLRILQAVPDDFVAHVGMSIIRDDENNLDEAIWHMERAFEVQPSNPAIQGELRRLYGRRDGAEPPKIRLSRDALANMYAQGELFNQAITEIRSVLAEDANRADLQVMLARAHLRAGQKVEATEIAIQLLGKYPYCADALRILIDVLPGTTRSEDAETYRRRLYQLDPYASFVTGSVFQSTQVADAAVSLQRLTFSMEGIPVSKSGDWASLSGGKLYRESKTEEYPKWPSVTAPPELSPTSPSESAPASTGGNIPDWLREAGWKESNDESEEGSTDLSGGSTTAESIVPAEIPDWLRSMAPPETTQVAKAEPAGNLAQAGELPEWVNKMTPEPADEPVPGTESRDEVTPNGPSNLAQRLSINNDEKGWMESLEAKQGTNPEDLMTKPEDRPADAPDSVNKLEQEALASLDKALKSVYASPDPQAEAVDEPAVPATEPLTTRSGKDVESQPTDSDEDTLAVWLKNLDETGAGTDTAPAGVTGEASSPEVLENKPELPDWLQGLERSTSPAVPATKAADESLERLNGAGSSVLEEKPSDWVNEDAAPVAEPPSPTTPAEWIRVEDSPTDPSLIKSIAKPVPIQSSQTDKLGQTLENESDLLSTAQIALKENRVNEAIQIYMKLIRKGRLLEDVIHDLREANYRFPVDIIVWQTLGDAYMRANHLQEALDAYTEAEKLLR